MWLFRRRKRVPVQEEDKPLYRATINGDNDIRGLVEHIKFFRSLACFDGQDLEIVLRAKKSP